MRDNIFKIWAAEINKEWTEMYKATPATDKLTVNFNSEPVAQIDYNNGRYTVSGTDKDAVACLEYMTTR